MINTSLDLNRHKFGNKLHILVSFLYKGCMTRILKCHRFDFLDLIKERLHDKVLRYVLPAVDHKRRHANEMQPVDDGPILHYSRAQYTRSVRQGKTNLAEERDLRGRCYGRVSVDAKYLL